MTLPKRKRTRYAAERVRAQELLNAEDPPPPASRIGATIRREFRSEGPTDRQIRNWLRDGSIVLEASSAPWTVQHAERPEDIPLVLEVMEAHRHPTWWLTAEQGRWVARLRRAFPSMNHVTVLDLARKAVTMDELAFTKLLLTGASRAS